MAFKKNRHPQANMPQDPRSTGYRPAYVPGTQGPGANNAFRNQTGSTQYSRSNPMYSTQRKRKSGKGKKIAIGVCCALVVALVGCGTAFAIWFNNINTQLNTGDKSSEEIENINEQLVSASYDEPFNMLLIGSDKREGHDEDGARSDTNIVVRVDPVNNQATLVSIPRDTMIDIDGYGTNKFNAAYNYGGAAATIREASQLTGVGISHYAEVNFDALVGLVDAVGGVDVQVDERVDDPDADGTTDNPDWEHIVIEPGLQHLNGDQALTFARSRAYVDGDFTRTANQRKLIEALVDKVLALPVTEMPGVIQAAAQCVTTDLKISDIISLAQQFKNGGDLTMYSAMLPSITGDVDGVSYVFADEDKVTEMMQVVESGGDPSGITGSTSKLAQKYSASTSAGTTSSSGSGSHAGNDYDAAPANSGYGTYSGNDYGTDNSYSSGGYGTGAGYVDSSTSYGGTSGGTAGESYGYTDPSYTQTPSAGAGTGAASGTYSDAGVGGSTGAVGGATGYGY